MFGRNSARKAFEKCEVKKVVAWPTPYNFGRLACAKYPEGKVKYSDTTGEYAHVRERLAQNLGCAACPFKEVKLLDFVGEAEGMHTQEVMDVAVRRIVETEPNTPAQ